MTIYRLELPWDKPPLTLNNIGHWATRRRLTAQVRESVGWIVKAAEVPKSDHCTVTLEWQPPIDWRVRDEDNPVLTLKPAADGCVDAGLVLDDSPQYMKKEMPVVLPAVGSKGRMWLVVTVDQAAEVTA